MRVSIITVVLNNVKYIKDCIESITSQTYGDIEYIIIDGGSQDGTLDVINQYKNKISRTVSGKDNGPYDALNKGLKLATGDVIGFLHSDDFYANNRVIEKVVEVFKNTSADSLYGSLVYVKKDNPKEIIRFWKGEKASLKKIKYGWMPPHPTFFVKKEIYDRYGGLDTDFKISADYELILRLLYQHRVSTYFMPEVMVRMRMGGLSNRRLKYIITKTMEDYKSCRMHGLGISTVIFKNIIKLPQFLMKGD